MPYRYNPLPKQFDRVDTTTVPDDVLKQINTDVYDDDLDNPNGVVIPASNEVNLLGSDTIQVSDYGIRTNADPNNSENCYIQLTNRLRASTILGAGTTNLLAFNLGDVAGVYNFEGKIVCFDSVTPAGASFNIYGSCRTTGLAGTIIGFSNAISDKEAALNDLDFDFVIIGNDAFIQATNNTGLSLSTKILVNFITVE